MKIKLTAGEISLEATIDEPDDIAVAVSIDEPSADYEAEKLRAIDHLTAKFIEIIRTRAGENLTDNCRVGYMGPDGLEKFEHGGGGMLYPDAAGITNPTEIIFRTEEVE